MIKVICVGKLKEKYLTDMVNDYVKRINKYNKLEVIELKDSNLKEEKGKIMQKISKNDYIITLDIKGTELSSIELANKINKLFINGRSDIVFIVGSSLGVHKEVKELSDYLLSFGKMTFPHGIFRGILLEQIYRTFKIINNETYHK